jgi:hypothetical protein
VVFSKPLFDFDFLLREKARSAMARVLFLPFNGFEVPEAKSPLKRKHDAIWDNAGRNMLIATVAEKLAQKPRKLIRGYGIDTEAVQLPNRVRQRVVILVENVEHARRLASSRGPWSRSSSRS